MVKKGYEIIRKGGRKMPIPKVKTGPNQGQERKRRKDGQWRKKRSDAGVKRK